MVLIGIRAYITSLVEVWADIHEELRRMMSFWFVLGFFFGAMSSMFRITGDLTVEKLVGSFFGLVFVHGLLVLTIGRAVLEDAKEVSDRYFPDYIPKRGDTTE
ncbi:hypothetical protein [Natrialba sp. PRR66]|uniref:hypothetical protein n=1 Tax=Natrialba sp. PRR66 TaxID=3098146 RepID=UPI002B1D9907|nr:hypothetical protein [Natrialba sp. PRR66]